MQEITSAETILPPVAAQVSDFTRGLIERAGNRTDESARIKIGPKAHVNIRRSDDGSIAAFLHDGIGVGTTMVRSAEDARDYIGALTAFADTLDAAKAEAR